MACPTAWFQNKFPGMLECREASENVGIQSGDEPGAGNRSFRLYRGAPLNL